MKCLNVVIALMICCAGSMARSESWNLQCPSAEKHPAISFGLGDLKAALAESGVGIVEGQADLNYNMRVWLATEPPAQEWLRTNDSPLPEDPESFIIASAGAAPSLAIIGRDAAGVMYGCLELAERVRLDGAAALHSSQPITQAPFTKFRAVNLFITLPYGAETWDTWWFLSDEFWQGYLNQLARARFNWIDLHGMYDVVATTFPNIYPYFISSTNYPGAGIEPERAARHLAQLHKVTRMAADRGIHVALMSYGTQFGAETGPWKRPHEFNWSESDLADYNRECVSALLKACPDLAMIGFRIGESGKGEDFFKACYVPAIKESGREIPVCVRTWGALKSKVLELADEFSGRLFVEIKYNGEQLGPPHIVAGGRMGVWRDYSYQNYLSEPRPYSTIYQVRVNGTHRVFPWAQPELIRITIQNARLGNAEGVSIEPINAYYPARNYQGRAGTPGAWYHWVFERDWFFYHVWGRLAYDPDVSERVWIGMFGQRFGTDVGEDFYRAFATGSLIIPRIFTFAGLHPDHRGAAPELEVGGDLWMAARHDAPFDLMNVQAPIEYAWNCVNRTPNARMSPLHCADILDELARQAQQSLEKARTGGGRSSEELEALAIDLQMLVQLGHYWAERLRTATYFALYTAAHDLEAEKAARAHHATALDHWRRLSSLGEQMYRPFLDTLRMHTEQFTWWGEAKQVTQGGFPITSVMAPLDAEVMARLEPRGLGTEILNAKGDFTGPAVEVVGEELSIPMNGVKKLTIRAHVTDSSGLHSVLLRWKPLPSESMWRTVEMSPEGGGKFQASVDVFPYGLMWGIEALDADGNGTQWPDFMTGVPYRWIEPWRDEAAFAPPAAEAVATGLAADRARFRAVAIGRHAENFARLDAETKSKLIEAVANGALLYIDCQDFTRFPLDWLPGHLHAVNKASHEIHWDAAAHSLVAGLPEKIQAHHIATAYFDDSDAEWTLLGEPRALAVRRHGQGWIVLNQTQLFERDPVTAWIGLDTYAALTKLMNNIFDLTPDPTGRKPVLLLDLGEGTIVDILSAINIWTTLSISAE